MSFADHDTHAWVEKSDALCRRLRAMLLRAEDRYDLALRECRCGHCEDRRAMEVAIDREDRAFDVERGK